MDKEQTVSEIVSQLSDKKYDFLNDVESTVENYISNQGAKCLTINQLYSSGSVYYTYDLSPDIEYIKVLIAFCRGKKYEGYSLDSGLTPGIVSRVTSLFEKFYEENNNEISIAIMKALVSDRVVVEEIVKGLFESSLAKQSARQIGSKISQVTISKATDMISDQLQIIIHSSSFQTITATTTHAVGSALSVPVVKAMAMMIVKALSTHIGAVVSKILASAAFKTAIGAAIKKFLGGLVLASIAKAVAAKFGIGIGAAFAWILLPIVIGYIAYEICHFPKELGEKVSERVRNELSGEYNNINRSIVTEILTGISGDGLVSAIMENSDIQSQLSAFIENLVEEPV